jgi:hypothetical protein
MCKININVVDGDGVLVSDTDLNAATTGIRWGLIQLGELLHAVKKVEISYTHEKTGFRMTVHFADPLGNESYCGTDYRFIGSGSQRPSAKEISDFFTNQTNAGLYVRMKEFLLSGRRKLRKARATLERQLLA